MIFVPDMLIFNLFLLQKRRTLLVLVVAELRFVLALALAQTDSASVKSPLLPLATLGRNTSTGIDYSFSNSILQLVLSHFAN